MITFGFLSFENDFLLFASGPLPSSVSILQKNYPKNSEKFLCILQNRFQIISVFLLKIIMMMMTIDSEYGAQSAASGAAAA